MTSTPTDEATPESQPRVEVLHCPNCGAAVPLSAGELTECRHCRTSVAIPEEHQALRAKHAALHDARRDAEATWQELPRPLPPWLLAGLGGLYLVALPVWPVVCVIGWVFYGWFDNPLTMLTFGIFGPLLLGMYLLISYFNSRSYAREVGALCADLLEGGDFGCRICGAALEIEAEHIAASCDYCRSDSLVVDLGLRGRRKLADKTKEARRSLGEAVYNLRTSRRESRLTRLIVGGILLACWLPFAGLCAAAYW